MVIKRKTKSCPIFTFNDITKGDVTKDIKNLDDSKASQEDDIPTKRIKENSDIFSNFIYQNFNNMIDVCIFLRSLKLANITRAYKKVQRIQRKITGRQVSCQISQNFTKSAFVNQYQIILEISFQNFNVALVKVSVHNIVQYL